MAARTSTVQPAPANFAPLVAVAAVLGGVVATFFQLPGAVIIALGIAIASFFYNAPPALNPKEPAPDDVQRARRRWSELRWRPLVPNGDWLLNHPNEFQDFVKRAEMWAQMIPLSGQWAKAAGYAFQGFGFVVWFLTPTRFVQQIAIGAGLIALTLPANLSALAQWLPEEMLTYDLVWLNAILAYGVVMGVDAAIRRSAAIYDPSPGVPVMALLGKALGTQTGEKDGGAWRAIIGFTLLGAATGVGAVLIILALGLEFFVVPVWLFGLGVHLVVTAACMHGVARNDGLAEWRDKVAARAEWAPRWEAMKYPEVTMTDHQRVGSFVVDTFEAPPSLGSAKAINLYNTVVPYLAAGGDVTVAMLTVESSDSQGQPIPGSAHATRFRVVVAPGDAQVQTLDPAVDVEELKLAAEVGAFNAARELNTQVPILLELSPAHTADSPAAVWQTTWTVPLASAATVAWTLDVDPESGIFSEGRSTFFGDFAGATLSDKSLPGRMEKASYEARWAQRWTDALKQGEKQPHLQYAAIKREKLGPNIEVTYEPFLVGQGLSPAQFFSKDMCKRILTTLKAAPFLTVVGITGALAGNLGPGIRHGQGFAVVHASTAIPSNPAEIVSPGPRVRDVAKWVMGGLINRAFEDAKLPYPEVITAEALTRPQSKGHVWKVHLRLYDGVTTAQLKLNAAKFTQSLGGVRWLRFEESEHGCYIVMGAQPHADGVKFANPQALAYCDKLDWAQAFQDVGIRSVSDGSSPLMLDNAPLETNENVTRMVFSMPQGANLGKIVEATDKLRSATANDYVEVRPADTPDQFVILAAEQNPIPFPAYPDWDQLADISGKGAHRLPFASTTDGSSVCFDWRLDPHLNVLGASGGGKSILLQILMAGAILRDCDVFLIDPIKGGQDFDFAVPYVRAMVPQGDYLGAGELLQLIGREAEERKKLNVLHKVGNYKDLPDGIRPRHMFVIIDEFQSLLKSQVRGLKEPTSGDETEMAIYEVQRNINTGVGKVATHIGKLAREARSVGITLVLAGQAMKAADLEAVGLGGLKVNFSRIAVGKMSYGEMASAFKDPSTLPNLGAVVPPGRGIFESTAAQAITVQNWWEPGGQDELGRRLAESVPAIDDDRRVDIESLTARVLSAAPKAFGAVMEDEIEVDEDEPEMLDAADLGLDLSDLSFDEPFAPALANADDGAGPEEEFTLVEPPTDHNLAASTIEPEAVPVAENHIDGERPLFHPGQFVDIPRLLEGRIVIGENIVFGVNSPTGDGFETGWPEGDALQLLLRANPGITEIVWTDRILDELDDIGIAREDIARDICGSFNAVLLTHHDLPKKPEAPAPDVPEPDPVADVAPALFEMEDFDEPTFTRAAPAVPDLSGAEDIFAPRTAPAPPTDGPSF